MVAAAVPDVDLYDVIDRVADPVLLADARGVIVLANTAAAGLFGRDDVVGTPITDLMPERFRAAHLAGFSRLLSTGTGHVIADGRSLQASALRPDGSEVDVIVWLDVIGRPGEPGFAIVATIRDSTERAVLQRQVDQFRFLQASVEASTDGVLAVSPERRVMAVNRRFCEMWRLPEDAVQPGDVSPLGLSHCLSQVADPTALRGLLSEGRRDSGTQFSVDIAMVDGRMLVATCGPLLDEDDVQLGRVWYLRDDTERRGAEVAREELLDRLRSAQRGQAFLLEASDVLARASSYAETLERLAAVAVPTLADLCLIDVISPTGQLLRMAARHADPAKRDLVEELQRQYPPLQDGPHPSVAAIARHESRWSAEMSQEFLRETTRDERHFQLVNDIGFESYMTVPLIAEGEVLGAVSLVSAGSGRRFGPSDLALAEDLASRVAQVVVRARRYDREHLASHALQASLLPPRPPALAGLTTVTRYLPGTTGDEVGGDFYDVVPLGNGAVALAIGDVTGHDLTAAATMGRLRTAFRALLASTDGPGHLIDQMQDSWRVLGLPRLATALFARLDPSTGDLQIASAGHPPLLAVSEGLAWFPAVEPSSPLGAPAIGTVQWNGTLPEGGTLLLYTDGLIERRGEDIDSGLEQLRALVQDSGVTEPEALADVVLAGMLAGDRRDDIALLVVRRDEVSTSVRR